MRPHPPLAQAAVADQDDHHEARRMSGDDLFSWQRYPDVPGAKVDGPSREAAVSVASEAETLRTKGCIVDSGVRRVNASGKRATVWRTA
jgi:hypothetical protein